MIRSYLVDAHAPKWMDIITVSMSINFRLGLNNAFALMLCFADTCN
jgi:hypothetical protein